MKTPSYATVWSALVLVCIMSRAAAALYRTETQCFVDCALYGNSRVCACQDLPELPMAPEKRMGLSLLLGKQTLPTKRQKMPFRYGKRAERAAYGFTSFSSVHPSAYGYTPLRLSQTEEDM